MDNFFESLAKPPSEGLMSKTGIPSVLLGGPLGTMLAPPAQFSSQQLLSPPMQQVLKGVRLSQVMRK